MESTKPKETQEIATPKAELFTLKTPYMKQGRITPLIAKTSNLEIHVKVNAEGGENVVHTHLDEDHAFVVLEGQMSIYDDKGNEIVVKPYQGVMLPAGAYYRYHATGKGNLVLLRVCAKLHDRVSSGTPIRIRPDGREILAGPENLNLPPIQMPDQFFAESAGLD